MALRPEPTAPEEFQAAVRLALSREFGVTRDGLVASTVRQPGYGRRGRALTAALEAAIDTLEAAIDALAAAIDALEAPGALRRDAHGFLVLSDGG